MDKANLTALRHRISSEFKDKSDLDFRCSSCGVGINKNEETFVVAPDDVQVWCKSCRREKDA